MTEVQKFKVDVSDIEDSTLSMYLKISCGNQKCFHISVTYKMNK